MECPKCGLEVDDNATTCPNCRKVLRIPCPICQMLNDSSTCKRCGYVIVTKCNKCGKTGQTFSKTCKSCGFDLEKSVILNEANGDDFAMLTLEFPNLDDIKSLMCKKEDGAAAFTKFKNGLDKMITNFTKTLEIRRQIINKVYVLRFVKDYTFSSSTESAMDAAVELANKIINLNFKLNRKKDIMLRCNMTLMKRNIEDDPNNYQSGLNINLMPLDTKSEIEKLLNGFQVISDPDITELLGSDYKFEPLNSVMVNGKMAMFYETDIKPFIKIEIENDEGDGISVPNFVQNMLVEQDKLDGLALSRLNMPADPDAIYDIEPMKLTGIQSDFLRTENIDVFFHVINRLQAMPKGILAIKTAELYKPYILKIIAAVQDMKLYNNIIVITCYDEMKYSPYSFFRELTGAIFEYAVSQKLFAHNDFSMFRRVDPDGLIKDLITLHHRDVENSEDTRYVYFDLFLTLLQSIPKTMIYIDNFDKIDDSSYDVLKYLFDAFDNLDISYLISYEKDFSLHKNSHFLLTKDFYSEINLKPTPFAKIIEDNKEYFKNVINSFYFRRIEKYASGSIMFLDVAIQYLIESGVFFVNGDALEIAANQTVIIPSALDKLFKRRLDLLQDDAETMRFLASIVLLGTRVDMKTVESLGYENSKEIIEKLTDTGYIFTYNNALYFPNYNLLRDCLLESINKEYLEQVAEELFDKVMDPSMPSPTKAYLYGLLGKHEQARAEWEALAAVNISLGDFNAYLHCTNKVLEILDKDETRDEELIKQNEEYKFQLYENISINLYEYHPDKTPAIVNETLHNLEQTTDTQKIIILCNKMIQGCLAAGDYNQALQLSSKVLSLLPVSSLDPKASNFNHYFFLMSLVHIQILFNIGALKECIEMGNTALGFVSDANLAALMPEYFKMEQFKDTLCDIIGYVALANVLCLNNNVGEFLKTMRGNFSATPASYDVFVTLQDFLHGKKPGLSMSNAPDKFSKILMHIMNAFMSFGGANGDYTAFADEIYQAKVQAKRFMLHQIEMFCDLLVGYAYMKINAFKKANDIFFKIINVTNNNGMSMILYLAWYLMSELSLCQAKYNVANGIAGNSLIQLERNASASEYIIMLFKYNMFKVLTYKQQPEQAQICIEQAKYIAQKNGIDFAFDDNVSKYVPVITEPAPAEPAPAEPETEPPSEQEIIEQQLTPVSEASGQEVT